MRHIKAVYRTRSNTRHRDTIRLFSITLFPLVLFVRFPSFPLRRIPPFPPYPLPRVRKTGTIPLIGSFPSFPFVPFPSFPLRSIPHIPFPRVRKTGAIPLIGAPIKKCPYVLRFITIITHWPSSGPFERMASEFQFATEMGFKSVGRRALVPSNLFSPIGKRVGGNFDFW